MNIFGHRIAQSDTMAATTTNWLHAMAAGRVAMAAAAAANSSGQSLGQAHHAAAMAAAAMQAAAVASAANQSNESSLRFAICSTHSSYPENTGRLKGRIG